jgi:enoyl-CoA hydratase/carnithine racemase
MAYQTSVYEIDDDITTIRFNDPERLTALTFKVYAKLERIFGADMAADYMLPSLVGRG